ncbi:MULTISPECIES: GH3 auxin-responsive promoter family protein [unclassified Leptolyngbya]|uniref:GH3 family domain-containing protein n=1 Tax=unclassified Leptolyngbya TaxID=2650499 RepID=UPI0016854B6D|nr:MULTISPECIES: GH3 auxin-responsive promoter family protein [unclassified Leptolyngbya]MBD1912838.1 GH3 auxin-responsive promoter family protein [Leptolyngbya sp. FACHB-8]MBD2153114.1 GH3 auxin-responsive promoter family protein [Leptolyngbya sp. FACHB-16]
MSLALPFLTSYASYVKNRFVRSTRQVIATQEKFLYDLLAHHQNTEIGQMFGLGNIKSIDQFREQVPVWSYNDYEPFCERIAQGESNLLSPDRVVYINLTSGSTGRKKQVPVTQKFQHTLRQADLAGIGFAVEGLRNRHRKFGKLAITNSVQIQGRTSAGIEYGPVSVGSIRKGKLLFEQAFAHPFRALEISDTLARHYVCLLFSLRNSDLRGMVTNFPMLLLRTCGYLEQYAEDLIHDLEQGTIAASLKIEPDIRADLEKHWSAVPKRAAQLRSTLQIEGRLTPKLAWTDLSFVTTARGGTSGFYLDRFPDYFDNTPIFGGVYGSAEATFSVYPDFNFDGGILAIESGFFEFVPTDQWHVEHPKTLLPHEVEMGQYYRILVTSYSGFYRYNIGDVVEVVGFYEQTPLITFRHRQGGLLSSTTEKTTEFHVTQVMQQLQQEFNLHLDDFCITLSDGEFPARYLVNIELAYDQQLNDAKVFLQRFEYWMREFNNPYGTVRESQVPPPRLRILAPGSFAKLRQRQVERGMFDSQLKIPHISEDRNFLSNLAIIYEIGLDGDSIDQMPVVETISLNTSPRSIGSQPRLITSDLQSFRGANLIQANLSQANLSGVDLAHADLSGADLKGANLSYANLTGAYLRETDLRQANLTGTILAKADLTDANLTEACLLKAVLQDAYLNRTQLEKTDLTNAQFGDAILWQCSLKGAHLAYTTFHGADLKKVDLSGARLCNPGL